VTCHVSFLASARYGDGYNELYCDAYCLAFVCDSDCKTSAGASYSGFKCYYVWSGGSRHWSWDTSVPDAEDGNPWQECFDGHDNDCDGLVDCADPDCARVKNPNTGVICCQSDSDCPAYDPNTYLKMYCDSDTLICKTIEKCVDNIECENKWCCDKLVGGEGNCKQKGTITSYSGRSYICDPPEGFVNSSNEEINTNNQANKKLTLFDLLINPFFIFSKSRI